MNLHSSVPQHHVDFGKQWRPKNTSRDADFKVIRVPQLGTDFDCAPYNIKGLYKITIMHGHNRVYFGDQMVEFKNHAILFSRPNMVYRFETFGIQSPGYLCVFTEKFFNQFVNIDDYPMFRQGASPIMEISEAQMETFMNTFLQMEYEVALDFSYKYDVVRTMVLHLIFDALKLQPAPAFQVRESNSALRITGDFNVLLEKQFPIIDPTRKMKLRHPVEFADALNIHVNHLNRSLKQTTNKTTSQLIADRITREARMLLQDTEWNITEIAWCLGFEDLAHFIKFFKKNASNTPSGLRKLLVV